MTRLAYVQRRRIARARAGALAFDTLLLAYGAWCVSFLFVHAGIGPDLVGRWPLLLLLAPLAALLWQALGHSLGARAYGIRLVAAGREEAPATADQRLFAALLGAVEVLLAAAPAVATRLSAAGLGGSLALLLVLFFLGLCDRRARSLPERLAGLAPTLRPRPAARVPAPVHRRFHVQVVLLLVLLTLAVGWILTDVRPGALRSGWRHAAPMIRELARPDWSITGQVVRKIVETVFFALMASSLALPVAFVLGFLGARNVVTGTPAGNLGYVLVRLLMNLARSVEPILWAIIFVLWVGTGPFAGMLALFVHSVAALAKLYSEAIETIDPGPVEAVRATGARPLHVIRYGIVPQVVPPFLSFTVYRWDINVRMATILGFVGGGGIGELLLPLSQMGVWPKVGTIIVFITLVVWVLDVASARARERLV